MTDDAFLADRRARQIAELDVVIEKSMKQIASASSVLADATALRARLLAERGALVLQEGVRASEASERL